MKKLTFVCDDNRVLRDHRSNTEPTAMLLEVEHLFAKLFAYPSFASAQDYSRSPRTLYSQTTRENSSQSSSE